MHRLLPLSLLTLTLFAACASNEPQARDVLDTGTQGAAAPAVRRVALAVQDRPLAEVVESLAHQAGIVIEVDRGLAGEVTLEHGEVPWDFSLRWVALQVGARVELQPGGARLVPSDLPQVETTGRRCGELVGGPRR